MTEIKTWQDRCEEHPDHQSGMVTHGMIKARMQEEIDDLRNQCEMWSDAHAMVVMECDRLRADAERYRWLREQMSITGAATVEILRSGGDWANPIDICGSAQLDAVIDSYRLALMKEAGR